MSEFMSMKHGFTNQNLTVREAGGDNFPGQFHKHSGEASILNKQ